MSKSLRWQECDKHISETLPNGNVIEHHITKELICDHPVVEKAWFIGFLSGGGKPGASLEIVTRNMERFSHNITDDQYQSLEIPEAEEWLQSLNATENK